VHLSTTKGLATVRRYWSMSQFGAIEMLAE